MSIMHEAYKAIRVWQSRHKNALEDSTDWAAQNLAGDLHEAGLLAPDLPTLRHDYDSIEAPVRYSLINIGDDSERYDDDSALVGVWAGYVKFSLGGYDDVSAYMSTEQARQFALALLAAAKYQEQQ
ncbi:hypothetical protein QPX34_07085 [Corynebacterium accolens]|uniref:Uncharacterized protein n=1 Tax=Corynebacterium accolens TaxID=38284 RepID=A0ABT7FQF2_9CORY|nr:hypothetical protein [Corynebacterium accolens]MDK4247789.1 hypothetical protein [Corynebacterium accolens]MDK4338317.1 hypothetical protein [Corynebacterium accolens]